MPLRALKLACVLLLHQGAAIPADAPAAGEIPADFRLLLVSAPRPARDEAVESIVVEASGRVRCSAKPVPEGELPPVDLEIPPEAVRAIYREVLARRFFDLEPSYIDPDVADGDWAMLEVTADGRMHKVTTVNIAVDDFDAIALVVGDQLPPERRIVYNALHVAGYRRVPR